MRKQIPVATLVLAAALTVPAPVLAQDPRSEALEKYMKTVKTELMSRRDATLLAVVQADESGRKQLDALKKDYDKELLEQARDRMKLIAEFIDVHKDLTPEQAESMASRFFAQEHDRQELHQRYFHLISEKISPVVAVQFLQVQGQFETMAAAERSKYVPLAGE